jgi:hypothetical protein
MPDPSAVSSMMKYKEAQEKAGDNTGICRLTLFYSSGTVLDSYDEAVLWRAYREGIACCLNELF